MREAPPGEFPGEAAPVGEGVERIVDLANDVFGFSLTLLAVGIAVPALPIAQATADLGAALLALWPKAAIFVLSFFTVSLYWVVYQRIFRFIRYYDSWLLWLNQTFLLFIAFMPISSAVLGLYPLQAPAIVLFAGNLALTSLAGLAMWRHATAGRRLVAPDLSPQVVRYAYVRFALYAGLYSLAIVLAFVDPILTIGVWVLTAVLGVGSPPFFRMLAWLEDKLGLRRR